MTRARAGFTIVEMLIVTILGGLILGATLQILTTNQRTYTAQAEVIAGQQSTRMALEFLFNELREVSPAGGDIIAMGSDSIRVRLMRRFSYVCETNFSTPSVTVKNLGGYKFAAGDSVFVFADNDEGTTADDVWIEARVTALDSTRTCPHDASSASRLTFSGQSSLFSADSVGIGAPVRSFETFTFRTTTYRGRTYLGRRAGGSVVPIAGPLRDTGGLQFTYLDAFGATTTTPADVRLIEVIVRTGDLATNSVGEVVSDSITSIIYTRN